MKKLLLASATALVVATPAAAADHSPYVGIEGGILFPRSQDIDATVDFTTNTPGVVDIARERVGSIKAKKGYDLDAIAGYDFGMFRLEGELGYKRAKLKSGNFDTTFLTAINTPAGTAFTTTDFNLNNHVTVLSGMVNALADFGGNGGLGGYVGGGFGRAKVKELGDSDSAWAWQILAGVYMPISPNIDLGLKYRYFNSGRVHFDDTFAFSPGTTTCGTVACTGGTALFDTSSKFRSHSLLASLVYNFGAAAAAPPPPPPPPPPPAPEAPATQTCPDGSVILATSACPAPPPPPPPPAPVERGERGR